MPLIVFEIFPVDTQHNLCYTASMKKLFLIIMALVWVLPVQARVDAGELLGGLLQIVAEPQPAQATPAGPVQKKEPTFGEQMVLTLRGATDALLEAYKEEGREYAKEVGDIITTRIMEDKKINDTLDSMRIFCWAVIIYLTVVTLIVLYMLLRLRVLYARIMAELQKKENRSTGLSCEDVARER